MTSYKKWPTDDHPTHSEDLVDPKCDAVFDEAEAIAYCDRGDHYLRFCDTFLPLTKEKLRTGKSAIERLRGSV